MNRWNIWTYCKANLFKSAFKQNRLVEDTDNNPSKRFNSTYLVKYNIVYAYFCILCFWLRLLLSVILIDIMVEQGELEGSNGRREWKNSDERDTSFDTLGGLSFHPSCYWHDIFILPAVKQILNWISKTTVQPHFMIKMF